MPSAVNSKDIEELINGLKSGIVLWEDLISKCSKFSNSIKSMTQACSDLLDSMHTVCDLASKSSCGLRNTGISLTKLVLREKKMELKINNISNALNENLVGELEKCVNEWKRSSAVMKKEREHEWKRANLEYQKSLAEVERTEKKLRKKSVGKVGLSETANLQLEYANQDAQNKRRYVEELERCALRRAAVEERQRFKQFLALLKPILDCQLSMREDLDNLEEVVCQLYGEKAENLDALPEELEQNIQEHMIKSNSKSSIARSYSTLSKQQSSVSNGSRTSLNSNSMSTTSSEWNNNNVLINACMEVSSRLNENMSNISHDSGIKSDRSFAIPYEAHSSQEYGWDKTLTSINNISEHDDLKANNDSDSDDSSTEDDNDASTDHNSQDGIIDNTNELFLLPARYSNEEPHFELPPDYPDSLPPPPPPTSITTTTATSTPLSQQQETVITQSHYSQSFHSQQDTLYPNQSIPSPVYSNLMELKINAAKKFGANTLSRQSYKDRGQLAQVFADNSNSDKSREESSTSFTSTTDKDRTSVSCQMWNCNDAKDRDAFTIAPPPFYCNDEPVRGFGNCTEQDQSHVNSSRIPTKGDIPIKSTMTRRASFATEMQVPQTPKPGNSARRPSVQDKTPVNMYSNNKNRGRSMSVTRESNYEPDDEQDVTSEDFNTIRQRIVSRINNELKPPTLPKPEPQKKQTPSPNYMSSYDYSHNLSSPVAIRSNRFFSDRSGKHNITSSSSNATHNPQLKYSQQSNRVTGSMNHDLESAAGEEPADNDFDMSKMDHQPMTVSRKEDRFKQQLMHVLHASKSQDSPSTRITNHNESSQSTQQMSSFYNPGSNISSQSSSSASSSTHGHNNRNNPVYGKPKSTKSSIPNSKYIY